MAERLATNAEIRAKEVRLIGPEGKQLGIVPLKIAIDAARAVDLDLVEVAPNANPPVAKVMDYGKYLYEQERAARDARKKQKAATGQKAIRFRPKTDDHDIATKVRQARRFLTMGYSVRFQVMFRMRELRRPELGLAIFERLEKDLADVGQTESRSGLQGRFATMVMAPRPGVVRLRPEPVAARAGGGAAPRRPSVTVWTRISTPTSTTWTTWTISTTTSMTRTNSTTTSTTATSTRTMRTTATRTTATRAKSPSARIPRPDGRHRRPAGLRRPRCS